MKVYTTKYYTITVLSLFAFVMTSSVCSAQEWSREGKTEFFGMFQTMSDDTTSGSAGTFTLDSSTVYGFGIGHNLNNHFNINTDFLFGSSDFRASNGIVLTGDMDIFLWDVNLDYNLFEDRLTPLVTGGIGLTSLSTAISQDTNFSYNFGAGLRWDASDNFFVKAMYRITWTDMEGFGDLDFDGVMVGIGYMW